MIGLVLQADGPTRFLEGDLCSVLVIGSPPFVTATKCRVVEVEVLHESGRDDADYVDADVPGLVLSVERWFDKWSDDEQETLDLRVGFELLRLVPLR